MTERACLSYFSSDRAAFLRVFSAGLVAKQIPHLENCLLLRGLSPCKINPRKVFAAPPLRCGVELPPQGSPSMPIDNFQSRGIVVFRFCWPPENRAAFSLFMRFWRF